MAGTNNEITTTFKADISQFSDSISSLKRYISTVNSEFKVATKGSSDWAKSQDGLKAKITQLNRTLQAQEQIVAELEKEYDKVAKEQGENSEAAQKLTIEINKYRASIDKTKSSIEKYNKSLNQLGKEAKDGGKALDDLGKKAKDTGDGFTVAKGAIAGFIANGLSALVGATKNAVTSVLGLADATREYRSTLATLDTAADDAGVSADVIKDKFTDMMGVFNDEDSVTEGLNNLLASGFDESNIDAITQQLEGAAIKWKDTLKFEGLADGLQETLATGSAIGPFAEMLERSGADLEKFDEGLAKATTEADKQKYVLDELSKLGLAEVSKSYREQNAQMIEAQQANVNYQNAVATMGEKIEPITTKIREGFTRIVEKMIELVDGVDLDALAAKIDVAFTKFINEILPKIIEGLTWIKDNKDAIIAGILAIGGAFVGWKVVSIITGAINAIKAMGGAMKALNLIMSANPIGIVIAAISALVAAFIYLWNNCEEFRQFWYDLWEGIKNIIGVVVDWIKENWKTMLLFLVNPLAGIFKYMYDHFEGFRNFVDNIVANVKNAFSSLWKKMKDGARDAWAGIKSVFSKVGSFFSDTFSKAWSKVKSIFSTGGKIFTGIKDGITTAFKNIVNGLIGGINKVVSVPFNAINKMLNKIRNVSVAGVEPFKNFWGENPISIPEIPKLAKGAVVDKETLAMIGDAGKEAVIPLERNTQGLELIAEKMASKLNAKGMNGTTVNYYQTFARIPTNRYALKKAMSDSAGMYQLLKVLEGGM